MVNESLVSNIIDIKLDYLILNRTEALWSKIEEIVVRWFFYRESPTKYRNTCTTLKEEKKRFCPDFPFQVSMLLFILSGGS